MGLIDLLSDLYASISFTEVHADAPASEEKEDERQAEGGEEKGDEGGDEKEEEEGEEEGGEQGGEEESGDEREEEKEEEEEEEQEPEDPKPKLEEECAESAQCAPYKHHYDACVERVTQQHQDPHHKGPKEDCVEEFFHLSHCASQCAAPKLFRMLK